MLFLITVSFFLLFPFHILSLIDAIFFLLIEVINSQNFLTVVYTKLTIIMKSIIYHVKHVGLHHTMYISILNG